MKLLQTLSLLVLATSAMAQNGPPTPAGFRELITLSVKALNIAPQPVAQVRDTLIKTAGQLVGWTL